MAFATGVMWIILFGMVLLGIGFLVLQIFLSRAENKWLGLILPGISFLFSLLLMVQASEAGGAVRSFLVGNAGTVVYLLIYFAVRGKKKRNGQLDQMKIKDL
ncbi:hypothetical protein [Anaerotignum lactatifermentans]|uniref:hypothetical protein n=1 Tax=Anaerotignum lactatifermentans TaxID=160404 RepID=UPI001FAEBCB9|nr:hypothetical protein [Anaerotignum lactatifermentans]